MAKWRIHGCPKCGGDIAQEDGLDGVIWKCILCSREWSKERLEVLEGERCRLERERSQSPPE